DKFGDASAVGDQQARGFSAIDLDVADVLILINAIQLARRRQYAFCGGIGYAQFEGTGYIIKTEYFRNFEQEVAVNVGRVRGELVRRKQPFSDCLDDEARHLEATIVSNPSGNVDHE